MSRLFDSRTTEFAGQILEATGGEGVDVVLNSLTSEGFIDASLSCLKQGGRFVELARRDILSEEEMSALRPDVGYDILELDVLKKTDPAWVGRVLTDIVNRLGSGELKPIVHSRWPLSERGAALRFMRSARHLGKIVATASPLAQGHLRSDRTYLVTGGLGGIGCAVAVWLADRGAGTIVLNGRRDPDADAMETIRALRERGVNLVVELADATDTVALGPYARPYRSEPASPGGRDSQRGSVVGRRPFQPELDEVRAGSLAEDSGSLAPASRDRASRPRHFRSLLEPCRSDGESGTGESCSGQRLPRSACRSPPGDGPSGAGHCMGGLAEIGEAAEQKERIERQRSALGGRWFTPQQGLKAMERLMREDVATSVVMSMDWTVFEEAVEERPAFLDELLSADAESDDERSAASTDVLTRLGETPASERAGLLVSFLQGEVKAVLRLPSTPDPSVGFFDLGMDSLMSVELRNRLNRAFAGNYTASQHGGVRLPGHCFAGPAPGRRTGRRRGRRVRSGNPIPSRLPLRCRELPWTASLSSAWRADSPALRISVLSGSSSRRGAAQ